MKQRKRARQKAKQINVRARTPRDQDLFAALYKDARQTGRSMSFIVRQMLEARYGGVPAPEEK